MKKVFSNTRFQFWLLFVLIILIRFLPFFQGKTLIFGDNYSLVMPGKIFAAQWFKQGVVPLWNPYIFSGLPTVMQDTNQSSLYPDILFFVVLPPAVALNLTIITHLLIAYGGMYLLAKHWLKDHAWALVAAVLWMLSTQVTGSINNLATLQSIVWLPLVSYFGLRLTRDKRARIWFALTVLLQFLGGYPQHVIYGIALAVLLSSFKEGKVTGWGKWLKVWLITGMVTLGVSAMAWLPFAQALLNSTRVLQTEAQALVGSMHPVTLIKFILPYFFDNPAHGIKWGPAWNGQPNVGIYVTWLGWLAVAGSLFFKKKTVKKEVWFFALITLFTLLFSLGEYLPGFSLIQKLIPLFRIGRYPSMMMIVTNVILALWTARALQQWSPSRRAIGWLKVVGGLILAVGLVGWWANQQMFETLWHNVDSFVSFSLSHSPFHTAERDKIIMFEIVRSIVFNSLFFLASLFIFAQKKAKIIPFVLAGIIALEMICNTHGQFFFAPNTIYDTHSTATGQLANILRLPATGFQSRLLTRNFNQPYTDYGSYWEAMVVRAPFSDSFVDAQELKNFDHAQALRDGLTPNWNMAMNMPMVNGYTTLLPQDYATLWQHSAEPRINFTDQLDPADPLLDDWSVGYYVVDTWFKVEEDLSAFPLVGEVGRWQVRERPNAKPRIRFMDGSVPVLTDFHETPNSMSFTLENPANQANLIIADRYDQDWRVKINGIQGILHNLNGMRSIDLQPGTNRVQLSYQPLWLHLGVLITVLSLLISTVFVKRLR